MNSDSEIHNGSLDAEMLTTFTTYADSLEWGAGQRDESAWKAFLRAGSLGIPPQTAVELVTTKIKATGGTFTPAKIQSQLRRAYSFVGSQQNSLTYLSKVPKPQFDPEKLKAIAERVTSADDAWLRSHSPIPTDPITSGQFLDHLYAPGERVLVFTHYESQGQLFYEVGAKPQEAIPAGSPSGVWFLVNPVDGEYHPNPRQENKLSRRSEESVTSWRYLVLESDVADPNDWLGCLVQLPLKIAAIYTSGGKSIHALVRVDAVSKQHWDEERDAIKPIVVTLGADANAMTAVRLSRLPGTLRGDRPQTLLYLDPTPTGAPIISKASKPESGKAQAAHV